MGDLRRRAQVHAGQAQDGILDHAQIGFDGRFWPRIATVHRQVNRHIQHFRAFGIIHRQKENVAPAAMGQVHPHRGAFAQQGIGAVAGAAAQQFRANPQRLIERMSHAEHPLIAAHRTHAAPHLVGQRLEGEAMIRRRQRAGNAVAWAIGILDGKKILDGLFETTLQKLFVALEGNQPFVQGHGPEEVDFQGIGADCPPVDVRGLEFGREMKPMEGIKKEQRADPFVKIIAAAAKGIQFGAFVQQRLKWKSCADRVERLIPKSRIGGGDDVNKPAAHFTLLASNSTNPLNSSSRSWPARAMASCAVSRPYRSPMS